MEKTYTLNVAGLERELPIIKLNELLSIASFVILGDVELVTRAAEELIERIPQVDLLVTAEAKGIPLAFEMARMMNMKKIVVARKSIKPYMNKPIVDEVVSITTEKKQVLCLDDQDALDIKGKRIAIIDDVISTGNSIEAMERLVLAAGGIVTAKAAILAEGKASDREDIIYLEHLPLF